MMGQRARRKRKSVAEGRLARPRSATACAVSCGRGQGFGVPRDVSRQGKFAVIHVLFLCQPCALCSFTCTGPGSPLEGLDHVSWSSGGRLDHQITAKQIIIAYFFRNPHVLVHVQTACTCNHVVILRDPIRCSTRIAHTHVLSPHFQLILHAIQVIYIHTYIHIHIYMY